MADDRPDDPVRDSDSGMADGVAGVSGDFGSRISDLEFEIWNLERGLQPVLKTFNLST